MNEEPHGAGDFEQLADAAAVHHESSRIARSVVQAANVHGSVVVNVGSDAPTQPPDMVPATTHTVVPRPELTDRIVGLLCAERGSAPLLGLTGTGGFGKTTLAAEACRAESVRQRFPDGVLWVTIGEDADGTEVAGKINDLAAHVAGQRMLFTDPEQAGYHLGHTLGDRRCLLVIDDVWHGSQLLPFLLGAPRCARLATTRVRDVLPDDVEPVTVDAMTARQARALLNDGLTSAMTDDLAVLLARTGRWPVLLRLVNAAVRRYTRRGLSTSDALARVGDQLTSNGPAALDLANTGQRGAAVSATVEASLSLLSRMGRTRLERYIELAVFPGDRAIPHAALVTYWSFTGAMSSAEVEQLCFELEDLSLVEGYRIDPAELRLHDVLCSYLQHRVGDRMAELHRNLLLAYREVLPDTADGTPWWQLPDSESYLWRHLAYHLKHAGLGTELNTIATDFRWLQAVLDRYGPAAAEADLRLAGGERAQWLRRMIARSAHLLSPLEPPGSAAATLLSRLVSDGEAPEYCRTAHESLRRPHLYPHWPLPDAAHPLAQRVLHGDVDACAMAISPDGRWLALSAARGQVRVCDTSGHQHAVLTGHLGPIRSVAISPKGDRIVTTGADGTLRLWSSDGTLRVTVGHETPLMTAEISSDGTWLAALGADGTLLLCGTDGTPHHTIHTTARITDFALSPDATWLATTDEDQTIRLWNTDGTQRAGGFVPAHAGTARKEPRIGVGPDGTWLAVLGADGTLLLCGTDGTPHHTIHTTARITDFALSPDATWLATTDEDQTIRLWNTDGTQRSAITSPTRTGLRVVISPDGKWLATSGEGDRGVRLWSTEHTGSHDAAGQRGWGLRVLISPDGTWLATANGRDRTVHLRNADGTPRALLSGHAGPIRKVAISPDGAWLATAGDNDPVVRLWDSDGTERASLFGGRDWVDGLAISPDGTWLVTTGGSDPVVRLWGNDGTERTTLDTFPCPVNDIAIAPDGSWLAVAGVQRLVVVWDSEGTRLCELSSFSFPPTEITVSPDGSWFATRCPGDSTVRVWGPDGTPLARLVGHTRPVTSISAAPGGRWIATGGFDGTVRLWNRDGQQRDVLTDHVPAPVSDVAFSPDGNYLVSACGEDRTVRLWDAVTGERVAALRVDAPPRQVRWFPTSDRFAVTGPLGLSVFGVHP